MNADGKEGDWRWEVESDMDVCFVSLWVFSHNKRLDGNMSINPHDDEKLKKKKRQVLED